MSFAEHLAGLDTGQLTCLLERRPDVLVEPAPRSVRELALRLDSVDSVHAALADVDADEALVLRAVALGAASLIEVAARVGGTDEQVRDVVDRLSTRGLAWLSGDRVELPRRLAEQFEAGLARFRPVAQIVGRRLFWGREFAVTGAVLDPRPETETLVSAALAGPEPATVLDLGTGSGAILLTLLAEWPAARGLGTDIDAAALAVAAANAARLGAGDRARFARTDWTDGIPERFDLVVSNPPYLAAPEIAGLAPDVRDWEPRHALTAGPSGLETYRRIAAGLPLVLATGGRVLVEIGPTQAEAVSALLAAAGLARVAVHRDLDGRDRVLEAADMSAMYARP